MILEINLPVAAGDHVLRFGGRRWLERNNFEEDQSSFVHLVDLDSRDQSLVNTLGITRILLVCRRYQSVFFHKSSILLGRL